MASLFFFKKPVPQDLMEQFFQRATNTTKKSDADIRGVSGEKKQSYYGYTSSWSKWWNASSTGTATTTATIGATQDGKMESSVQVTRQNVTGIISTSEIRTGNKSLERAATREALSSSEDETGQDRLYTKTLRLTSDQLVRIYGRPFSRSHSL